MLSEETKRKIRKKMKWCKDHKEEIFDGVERLEVTRTKIERTEVKRTPIDYVEIDIS